MPKRKAVTISPASVPFGSPSSNKGGNKDDDEKPIMPSPFKTKARSAAARPPVTYKIHHVVPNVGEPGEGDDITGHEIVTVVVTGWMQKAITDAVYDKANNPKAKMFCEATDPVSRVFNLVMGNDPVMQEGNNGKLYPVKTIIFALDEDNAATQAEVETFVDETFLPALMKQDKVRPPMPIRDPTGHYVRHASWSDILGHGDGPIDLFKFHYKEGQESFPQWIKADKLNLYSVWPKGRVPESIKNDFNLTNEHLFPEDIIVPPVAAAAPEPDVEGVATETVHSDNEGA